MSFLEISLLIVSAFLLVLLIFSVLKNVQAGRLLRSYDQFYEESLDELQELMQYLQQLSKRDMISNDPYVMELKRLLSLFFDFLMEYGNANKKKEGEEKE